MKSVITVSMFVRRTTQILQNVLFNGKTLAKWNFILFIIRFVLLDSFIQIYSNHFLDIQTTKTLPYLTQHTMSSSNSCQDEINQEIATFNAIAFGSLGFTVACVLLRRCCKAKWQQNPEHGYMVLFGFAGVKFLIGILLFTVFLPTCPNGCICDQYSQSIIYPTVVILLSIYWAFLGTKYLALARQGQQHQVVPEVQLVDDDDDGDKNKLAGDSCDKIEIV